MLYHTPKQQSIEVLNKVYKLFEYKNSQLYSKTRGMPIKSIANNGYITVCVETKIGHRLCKKYLRAHHIIWYLVYGKWPTLSIDHRDNNKLNNSIDNLREANASLQAINKSNKSKKYPTGVSTRKNRKIFVSSIWIAPYKVYLGTFKTEVEAHEAYKRKYKEIHGIEYND